jgi:hypothetical protein
LRFLVYALAGSLLLNDPNLKTGGIMGLEKLQESIATPTEADIALTSQTPRLSLVRPEQTEWISKNWPISLNPKAEF